MSSSHNESTVEKERSPSQAKPPSPLTNRSCPERVVDMRRVLNEADPGRRLFTDHPNMLPFGLAASTPQEFHDEAVEYLLSRCVSLQLSVAVGRQCKDAVGQAGFIMTRKGPVMLTVKHNFCNEVNRQQQYEAFNSSSVVTPGGAFCTHYIGGIRNWRPARLTAEEYFKFDAHNSSDASCWKYGNEAVLLEVNSDVEESLDLANLLESDDIKTFEAVGSDFVCEEGMTVGVMAHSCTSLLAEGMKNEMRANYQYNPQQGDTFVTAGEITHVGEEHIEYKVNTVGGFSGAPVFILNPNSDHHLQLVAVHAGFSESRETNFGFLVADKLQKYEED